VNTPRAIATQRMVIAEAAQNPQLGRVFYDAGPARCAPASRPVRASESRRANCVRA
jgi:hypothetical protein